MGSLKVGKRIKKMCGQALMQIENRDRILTAKGLGHTYESPLIKKGLLPSFEILATIYRTIYIEG